jgi:hypothetical protein
LPRRALGHAIAGLQTSYGAGKTLPPSEELKAWLRMHVSIAPTLIRMVKITADYAASDVRDEQTDRLIRDFYKWEQNFLADCLRRGIVYALPARGDERIAPDIESLRAIVGSSALATRPSTPQRRGRRASRHMR